MGGGAAVVACLAVCTCVSGGGTGLSAANCCIKFSRARSAAVWFMALRAKIKATIAITIAAKSNGLSSIGPPDGRIKPCTGHVSGPLPFSECSFAG